MAHMIWGMFPIKTEQSILQLWNDVEKIDKFIVIGYFIYSGSAAARLFKGCSSANVFELVRYSILIPFLLSRNLFGTGVLNIYHDHWIYISTFQVLISLFFCKRYFTHSDKIKQN